ncbi:MAG: PTS IIA-like nitrogen regulatory protein PtsN [Gammaproteobacteria bacterium]|nr:PTS IIA-like nitrogen regulatory protein PtsN [Gammaproteobacteria bacterium]
MNISQLIAPDRVLCLNEISSKKRILEKLSQILALGTIGYDHAEIFNRLIERERLGSTGLGHGVALPHGRYGENEITIGAFIKLDKGIDFDSPDGQPTDLLFALLVPEHHTDEHLQVLASLARMFSDKDFCTKLRQCDSDEELFQHLSGQAVASETS